MYPPPSNLVAFGDSITHGYGVPVGTGWVEILSARLQETQERPGTSVFNAGGDGNTSTEGMRRIEADVLRHQPRLVLVEFGGNDAVEGTRNVSLDDFEHNLKAIYQAITANGGKMVLITFPPIINAWHVSGSNPYFLQRGGLDHEVERYRQRTREVAQQLGLPLFDLDHFLRGLIEKHGPSPYIARDGVHLTPEGNRVVSEAVLRFLKANRLL